MLFLYECPRCKKKEGYYDNGELYISKPNLCEKCGSEIKVTLKMDERKDLTTWIYECNSCDFKKTEINDHKKWQEEHAKQEAKDKELLEKYRNQFCFSEKEGTDAVLWYENLKNLMDNIKKDEEKKKDPAYQKAKAIKKYKVLEIHKLLKETLEKEDFVGLEFEKPEIGQYVIVTFIVQESNEARDGHKSELTLQKLIKEKLESTNWRLMSEGTSYRAGYLNGRLKCYEREDDLAKEFSGSKNKERFSL